MSLLKFTFVFGLVLAFTSQSVSQMDFSAMNFARDAMMQFSRGTEQTIQILKPGLKTVNVPVLTVNKRKMVLGGGRRRRRASFKRTKTKMKKTTKLTFVRQTKTFRARSTPSNAFLEALTTIERGVAHAKASPNRIRHSVSQLQRMKNTIKLAVQTRLFKYARHKLGETLYAIKEYISTPRSRSRSRRSAQNQASRFINDLKRTMGSAQFDKFMAVMGDVTLMFAIDTTGSMSDEIDAAKRIAVDVINFPRENPVNYILSPFNDPSTEPVTFRETTEGGLFVDAISKLKAKGGGDCAELAMKGILDAMYEGPDWGSPLYVFTDASAKDASPENVEEVKSLAKYLGITINFFTTGECTRPSQTNNAFKEIAESTSGQMLRLSSDSELRNLTGFTGSVLGGSNIISSGSNISYRKKRATPTASRYSIKIDDSIDKVSLCISTDHVNQGSSISLTDPQGVTITSGKVTLSKVSIYEISSPRVGTWTLVIPATAGQHNYFVKSNSDSNIDFEYYFLRTTRKPPFEIPISEPLLGQGSKVIVTVAGAEKVRKNSVVLELITRNGQHIRDIQLTPDRRAVRYVATFTPPNRPFKLKLKGTTKNGNPFERVSRSLVEPKSIHLRVWRSSNDFTLVKGRSSTITFHLYNSANVNKVVNIRVKDRLGYARVNQNARVIRRKRPAFFRVSFSTPRSAAVGISDTAVVTLSVNNGAERISQPVQLVVVA